MIRMTSMFWKQYVLYQNTNTVVVRSTFEESKVFRKIVYGT